MAADITEQPDPSAILHSASHVSPQASPVFDSLSTWLGSFNTPDPIIPFVAGAIILALTACVSYIFLVVSRRFLLKGAEALSARTSNKWDDALVEAKFFHAAARIVPGVIFYLSSGLLDGAQQWVERLSFIYILLVATQLIQSLVTAIDAIASSSDWAKKRPIKVYLQVAAIIVYVVVGIVILATLLDKNPLAIFTGLGALTAVLMLVFKDTILGFVAGIQLAAHDMVRIGDWIVMPKYGADGDVIDISVNTVKVQNWDKTISTVPTYSLVSDSFKNWRGMSESGGRRIKRSISIDMTSIHFCDEDMLETFRKFELIRDYIDQKISDIQKESASQPKNTDVPINSRRLTNVGTFRAYIEAYLRSHPKIHKDMTFLVRQLAPSATGLPIEIYVFSNDQVWAHYESIQADIFDHLLASVPEFGLRVFQNPTGSDFARLV
jgi:miniconductance mechanosensitive channel